jgi:hypothetical protein
VDRWQTGVPTDEPSKTPLKIGICVDVSYPVDRWNDYKGRDIVICPLSRCPTSLDNGCALKNALKIGICIDLFHPLSRCPEYEGVLRILTFGLRFLTSDS